MGKTRDLFKKIGDTKGNFHAKMGTIKDTNGVDIYLFIFGFIGSLLPPGLSLVAVSRGYSLQ